MSITPRRRAALVAPLVLLGLALTGCGVSGDEQVRPDVAARVDGTDVKVSDVDDLASGTCTYLDTADDTAAYPRVTVRRLFLETLIRKVAAEDLVDSLDVTLPDDYGTTVSGLAQQYTDSPDGIADVMRKGDKDRYYVAYATAGIGNVLLTRETGKAATDPDQITARGNQAIDAWIADHDVDLNPTYGLTLDKGAFVAADGLSVAVSTEARDATALAGLDLGSARPDLQAALDKANASLPADQVCGKPAA